MTRARRSCHLPGAGRRSRLASIACAVVLIAARSGLARGEVLEPESPLADERAPVPNRLSEAERREGWRLLFDGESFSGWKIYGADDHAIEGWKIEEGALVFTRDVSLAGLIWHHLNPFVPSALDLMTLERFDDFELSIDWKISRGGNSGIFYRVPDERDALAWERGLEMQVLDDDAHRDGRIDRRRAGNLYDLQGLVRGATRPVGEWNRARIRAEGGHFRHWLNGRLIVDIVRDGDEWRRAHAASKFADREGHGRADRGHITLQDHGDVVWYRNIKIRPLRSEPRP